MRLADRTAIEHKLRDLDAIPAEPILETNTYYDTSEGRLKSSGHGLRIRATQVSDGPPVVRITHKGPRAQGQLKCRQETEVQVADARAAHQLLDVLGFAPQLGFEKRRRPWTLADCRVDLDTVPHLGQFVEIEGPTHEAVLNVRGKLDLHTAPLIRASYAAMLSRYISDNQLPSTVICFEPDAGALERTAPNGP